MARPERNKKYDASKHHMPKEVHQLPPRVHIALAQVEASMQAMREAKAHILMDAASNDWNYPVGKQLTFEPDYETGRVTVIMEDVKGVDKSNPSEEQSNG